MPQNILPRQIDNKYFLYLNASAKTNEIEMKGVSKSMLWDKQHTGNFKIAPFEPEFIEVE